jgi:hypothetical protein
MRTVHSPSLSLAAVAVLAIATTAAAQERPSGLLNSLEVRQLVARAEPADHLRLGAHFNALGDRYAAKAKRYIPMSQSFVGNPSRNRGTGMSVTSKRLADLNTQSATTVRGGCGPPTLQQHDRGRCDAGPDRPHWTRS